MLEIVRASDPEFAICLEIVRSQRLRANPAMDDVRGLKSYLDRNGWREAGQSIHVDCAGTAIRMAKGRHSIDVCGESEAVAWIALTAGAIDYDNQSETK